jgi:hypothetical protein
MRKRRDYAPFTQLLSATPSTPPERRYMSDSGSATTLAPSRRGLLHGAVAFALPLPTLVAATDPALVVAQRWCDLEAEQRRLFLEWEKVETWLFKHRNWPNLSDAERAAVPEGAQLEAIDDQLAANDKTYDVLLPLLRTTPAISRAGLLARFDALLLFLESREHSDARALLMSCQRDLNRLWV